MTQPLAPLPIDPLILEIADYVHRQEISSAHAYEIARHSLIDSLGCAMEALDYPGCTRLLGPVVPGVSVEHGARVPGTSFVLDPVKAAFDLSAMVRWNDFSDTWVAAQTTHPSDDLGAILAVADYLSRGRRERNEAPYTMRDVLTGMIQAHEIQGVLGMGYPGEHGIDHPLLVRVACAGVVARLLGGDRDAVVAAISLAFFDASLCVHRFGSNTGPRKSWASADAASHAVRLALMAVKGEPGYPQVLSHPKWGFNRVYLGGQELKLGAALGSQVMENVLFKAISPVVIHAQSAIECALAVYPAVRSRLDDIVEIRLASHQRTLQAIDKRGPLRNAADRDHCLQYAVAIVLLHGRLTAADYEDDVAADPRIDRLRALMKVNENPAYTKRYLDPRLRANPNSIEVVFSDGTGTGLVEFEYPAGHPARRGEGLPLVVEKFRRNVGRRFAGARRDAIEALCLDHGRLMGTSVDRFIDLWVAE